MTPFQTIREEWFDIPLRTKPLREGHDDTEENPPAEAGVRKLFQFVPNDCVTRNKPDEREIGNRWLAPVQCNANIVVPPAEQDRDACRIPFTIGTLLLPLLPYWLFDLSPQSTIGEILTVVLSLPFSFCLLVCLIWQDDPEVFARIIELLGLD
jgi:hypothetical protein